MTETPSAGKEKVVGYFKTGRRGQDRRARQVEEYVVWINSHLKKKPKSPLLYDIKGLLDGIALVNLVEVLGQKNIEGVDRDPSSKDARMKNIELVLKFLEEEQVSLPENAFKELSDCNVKGVLKVVLAIAQHYNPLSIRRSINTASSGRNSSGSSSTYINTFSPVQSESVPPDSPAQDLMHNSSLYDHLRPKPTTATRRESAPVTAPSSHHHYSTPLSVVHQGKQTPLLIPTQQGGHERPEYPPSESLGSMSSVPSAMLSRTMARDTPISGFTGVVSSIGLMRYTDSMISPPTGSSGDISPAPPPLMPISEGPITQIDGALEHVTGLKGQLLQLFALLRENPDGCDEDLPELSHSVSELIGQNGHMTSLPEEVPEVQQLRDDVTTLQSECSILQSVVDEKEDLIRQLKSDILRLDYKTETEREELRNIVSEKQLVIEELDMRLEERDKAIQEQSSKINELEELLYDTRKSHEEYLRQYEDKVTELQELKQTALHRTSSKLLHPELVTTEAEVIRLSLSSLRRDVGQSQQSSLDHLEQSVARLMDHLSVFTKKSKHDHSRYKDEQREKKHRRPGPSEESSKAASSMKVMFIMDKDPTPYRINVPFRNPNGPVLGDFKRSLGKKGAFRYYFRSSEDGSVVKVELAEDSTPLPVVDGKIMAWIYSS